MPVTLYREKWTPSFDPQLLSLYKVDCLVLSFRQMPCLRRRSPVAWRAAFDLMAGKTRHQPECPASHRLFHFKPFRSHKSCPPAVESFRFVTMSSSISSYFSAFFDNTIHNDAPEDKPEEKSSQETNNKEEEAEEPEAAEEEEEEEPEDVRPLSVLAVGRCLLSTTCRKCRLSVRRVRRQQLALLPCTTSSTARRRSTLARASRARTVWRNCAYICLLHLISMCSFHFTCSCAYFVFLLLTPRNMSLTRALVNPAFCSPVSTVYTTFPYPSLTSALSSQHDALRRRTSYRPVSVDAIADFTCFFCAQSCIAPRLFTKLK